jgi:hypothetical protein
MVLDVYTGKGWYQRHPGRNDIAWLKRDYPRLPERMNYIKLNQKKSPWLIVWPHGSNLN